MISYLIHSSILLSLFTLFYYLVLRNETFFRLNRWSIMAGVILSMTLPLLHIPETYSFWKQKESVSESIVSKIIPSKSTPDTWHFADESKSKEDQVQKEILNPEVRKSKLNPGKILAIIYGVGVSIFGLVFLMQLWVLYRRRSTLNCWKTGNYTIVEMNKDIEPYSFLHSIYINPDKYDEDTFNHIIEHEKIHIDQSHFIDKLIAEILVILFWFNPFVWLLRASISKNLEFLTDESLIKKGVEKQLYQLSLLKVSVSKQPFNLTMSYNSSFLKNRIKMMNSKKSSIVSSWKYLAILPLFILSAFFLNAVDMPEYEAGIKSEANFQIETPVNTSTLTVTFEQGKKQKFTLNGKGKLEVSTSGGHIAVQGVDGNEVSVTTNIQEKGQELEPDSDEWNEALKGFDLKVEKQGQTIVAEAKRKQGADRKYNNISISFEIDIPHQVDGEIRTSGGHISLADVQGVQNVHTSGGHIDIERVTGELTANTSGGHISVENQNGNAKLSTSGGHISVDEGEGDIYANTSGGAIKLNDIQGAVEARTSGGGIEINGTASKISAKTSGGSINVDVTGLTESLYLQTSGGHIMAQLDGSIGWDLDLSGSRVSANLENFSGLKKDNRIEGKMNGGGIPVTIKNSGGNVQCKFE